MSDKIRSIRTPRAANQAVAFRRTETAVSLVSSAWISE
jgi:hypothetical protein